MRLERFETPNGGETAINPEIVHGVAHVTDKEGHPLLGITGIKTMTEMLVVKGSFGEVCQKLEGTSAKRIVG